MGILADFNDKIEVFPDELNKRRRAAGLTNADCAEITGLTETQVSRFVSGATKNPNFYSVVALCCCLHFDIDKYFNGADETPGETSLLIQRLQDKIEHLTEREKFLQDVVDDLRKTRHHLYILLIILVFVGFGIFVICDLINPYFGVIYRL